MTRSLVLLPREPYRPRITDSRMSVFLTGKVLFSEHEQRARIYYAHRWRLEPSDMDAWKRGERVAPKKQIVFTPTTDSRSDVEKAFSRPSISGTSLSGIGFKNAIAAQSPIRRTIEFDPDNIKYSAFATRRSPSPTPWGLRGSIARSGEILNASVYVYHDVMKLLNNWLFVQTAQADERVRAVTIPEEVIGDGLCFPSGPRGRPLPGLHAQHERLGGDSCRSAPLAVVHAEVRHDHLDSWTTLASTTWPGPGARREAVHPRRVSASTTTMP